jgi:hypothetical protein
MKRKRGTDGPFVAIPVRIMDTRAWRPMSPGAKVLWIELRKWLRNDRLNNGKVYRSCREAAKAIGADKGTVARWYFELEHYGFLRQTAAGFLGGEGFGNAAKYRFTDLAHGTHPATRDYEKWDGVLFEYTGGRSQKRRPKKQNPVRKTRTPRTQNPYIRKGDGTGSVCTQNPYIDEAPPCTQNAYISRLPFPKPFPKPRKARAGQAKPGQAKPGQAKPGQARLQGSSTVRAPVQAGDAGSNPAPVANPSPTKLVLEMVAKLSPEVRMLALGLQP